jgi:hypothetical protein
MSFLRFPSDLVRVPTLVPFVLTTALAVVAGAGCNGCTVPIPFSVERSGTIALGLGAVDADCTDVDSEHDNVGGTDVDFTFTHHKSGDVCQMQSRWSGTFLDMKDVKDDAKGQVTVAGGADFSDIKLKEVDIDVDKLELRDADDDHVLDAGAGLQKLLAHVNILGHKDVIVAHFDADTDGDPNHPDVEIDTAGDLIDRLNDAFDSGDDVDGDGDCDVEEDMDHIDAFSEASAPAMVIDFKIKVKGTTHATIGG